jgi:hypothetical protein
MDVLDGKWFYLWRGFYQDVPVNEIHVTTQSSVSAIVGKCGERTKAFEGPLCQDR